MPEDRKSLIEKASTLHGCLGHLRLTTGRRRHETDDDELKNVDLFISDEAKIGNSKAYRTLPRKTQVFSFPRNALVRTRCAHVNEVISVSVTAANALGLNTDAVRAAAMGHDIGHVPFGHQGEAWMAKEMGCPNFCHEVMGVIIAQYVERRGKGLNLTWQTLQAMMRHSGSMPTEHMTQEAWVLRHTDKFAYIFHDYNDIVERHGYPVSAEIRSIVESFGRNQRQRTTTAICGLVIESEQCGHVSFEESDLAKQFKRLRTLMYGVYESVTQQNVQDTLGPVIECLTRLNIADPFFLLALMNDKDVELLASRKMKDLAAFNSTTVHEIVPYLQDIGPIDLCNPGLDW